MPQQDLTKRGNNGSFESSLTLKLLNFQYCRLGKLLNLPNSFIASQCYFNELSKVISNHGINYTLTLFKFYYDVVKSVSLRTTIPSLPIGLWIKTDSKGVPCFVNRLIKTGKINTQNVNDLRFILSLCSAYEFGSVTNPAADLKSLIDPQTAFWNPLQVASFKRFCESEIDISKTLADKVEWKGGIKDYVSLKGGPFGAATPSWTQDLIAISQNPKTLRALIEMEDILQFDSTSRLVNTLKYVPSYFSSNAIVLQANNTPLLVTQGIPDKGPKTRTITKGNYYVQRALKSVHDNIMNILKKIPEDGTYRQDKAAMRVKHWTKSNIQPYCFDLTAATDRMPVGIQYDILKTIGCPVADQWFSIMNKANSYDLGRKRFFEFNVGQPMGLYSSWPIFALTHHFIVRHAFHINNKSYHNRYSIIGDDVAIRDRDVALTYQYLILTLGINISVNKSITPENSQPGCLVGELAKRLFINGIEISPVRARDLLSLRNNMSSWMHIKDFALELSRRWGTGITWDLIFIGNSTSTPLTEIPILSFLKNNKGIRQKGRDLLESPFGGPRFHFFARITADKEGKQLSSRGGNIKKLQSFWDSYSNEWIGFAVECVQDKRLDATTQKLSDILATFTVLEQTKPEPSILLEFDSFIDFHESIWSRLDVNPFYQAVKLIKAEIEDIYAIPFIFRTQPAVEVIEKINNFSVQIDLIYDWLAGNIKRDISDLKVKRRMVTGKNMLNVQKYCQDKQLEIISLTSREIPEPSPLQDQPVSKKPMYFMQKKELKCFPLEAVGG